MLKPPIDEPGGAIKAPVRPAPSAKLAYVPVRREALDTVRKPSQGTTAR